MSCRVGLLITVLDEPKNKVFLFVSEACSFSLEQLPPQQAWKQASLAAHGDKLWEKPVAVELGKGNWRVQNKWHWKSSSRALLSPACGRGCLQCLWISAASSRQCSCPSLPGMFVTLLDKSACKADTLGASQRLPSVDKIRDSPPPAYFISKSLYMDFPPNLCWDLAKYPLGIQMGLYQKDTSSHLCALWFL